MQCQVNKLNLACVNSFATVVLASIGRECKRNINAKETLVSQASCMQVVECTYDIMCMSCSDFFLSEKDHAAGSAAMCAKASCSWLPTMPCVGPDDAGIYEQCCHFPEAVICKCRLPCESKPLLVRTTADRFLTPTQAPCIGDIDGCEIFSGVGAVATAMKETHKGYFQMTCNLSCVVFVFLEHVYVCWHAWLLWNRISVAVLPSLTQTWASALISQQLLAFCILLAGFFVLMLANGTKQDIGLHMD